MTQWIAAQSDGATAARSGVLMATRDDPAGTSLSDVGKAVGLGASALSGLIDRMEASDLVERRPDPMDRRAVRLHLTANGREGRATAIARARALNAKLAADFTEQELDVVARWLAAFPDKFAEENRHDG
ncbi:MAG: MarR family transcriptional regulator [Brevundimonas sp.]|uniref:MarR family winged helix-turn-helix transcriptional regulator n=1 Tax=Brevundimonas sp. TaxID=1871086 RepID=UPI00258336CF|nr:MarR family transcriptional regulator [Brevundimonas sp.]MCV0413847.1 MarR family transcriptional regulator [Brevundimonas sp.]